MSRGVAALCGSQDIIRKRLDAEFYPRDMIFLQPVEGPLVNRLYDATNGTISSGDIIRFGGQIPGFVKSNTQ